MGRRTRTSIGVCGHCRGGAVVAARQSAADLLLRPSWSVCLKHDTSVCGAWANGCGRGTYTDALATQVPDAAGVFFVPALSGLFAPHWREDARGYVVTRRIAGISVADGVCAASLWA
jgi:hypothetical protein